MTNVLLSNKQLAQSLETSNATINLNVTNATNLAKRQWMDERRATDTIQITAYQTTLKLFALRLTLCKNAQPHSDEAFKIFAVRQVLDFKGSNFTACEYYQAFKKKLDVVSYFFKANLERIKACEPTAEAIERLTLSIFKNYTSLNQAYKASQKEKRAKKEAKKAAIEMQSQTIEISTNRDENLIATPEVFAKLQQKADELAAMFTLAVEVDESKALESIKSLLESINKTNKVYDFKMKVVNE